MSPEKYGKIVKEMKETLPEAHLPSIEEIKGASTNMRDVLALAVARTEFVVALRQRVLDPKNQIYTANTFSHAVQNGLSMINVIVETITTLPDTEIWGYTYSQYPAV
jgi:hypothetical protein